MGDDRRTRRSTFAAWWMQEGRLVAAVLLFGALLRIVFVVQARGHLYFNEFNDFQYYNDWARTILNGRPGPDVFPLGPLYPHLLAIFYGVFGPRPELVVWLQALLGTAACGLIYMLGKMVFEHRVGLIAALIGACYIPAIFYETVLLATTSLYVLNLLMLVSAHRAARSSRWYLWALPGALLGLSALGRANVLLFLPFLVAGVALSGHIPSHGASRRIPAMLALLLGAVVTIAPATLHNHVKGRDLVLVTSNMGLNLFIGNNPDAPGYYEEPGGLFLDGGDFLGIEIASILQQRELAPSQVSRFWIDKTLQFARDEPGAFLRLNLRKLLFFWNACELPQAEHLEFHKRFLPLLKWPLPHFGVIGPLGLLGLVLGLMYWRRSYFLTAFVLSMMIATVLFFVLARLRLQACSVLIVFAAYAVTWLWDGFRAKRYRHVLPAVAALILLLILVNWPYAALNQERHLARSHNLLATHHALQGDLQGSMREYQRSLQVDPGWGTTYLNMAQLYHALDRTEEVWSLHHKALQMDPDVAMAHFNMGNMYMAAGDTIRAAAEFRAEIASNPYNAGAYRALAQATHEKENAIHEKNSSNVNPSP